MVGSGNPFTLPTVHHDSLVRDSKMYPSSMALLPRSSEEERDSLTQPLPGSRTDNQSRKAVNSRLSLKIPTLSPFSSPTATNKMSAPTPAKLTTNSVKLSIPLRSSLKSPPRSKKDHPTVPTTVGTTHTEVSRSLAKSSAALPRTPEVVRRYKNKVNVGSSKNVVEVTSRHIKQGSSGLLKTQPVIKQGLTVKPLAHNKPTLTQPKEFNFTTSKPAVRAPTGADAPDFSRMLRSYSRPPAEASQPLRTTQPQPFSRQERPRARSADRYKSNNDPNFKSQAEQIANFHGKTPARFRSRPISKERPRSRNRSASPAPRLTVPVTPQLCARGRTRPIAVLSQAEIEEREMEEHSKKQFKAHGVGETLPRFKH